MAKNIPDSFEIFKTNLEISNLQRSKVSSRQLIVRGILEEEFELIQTFLSGSYSRNTMIAPLNESDIDIFTVLDSSHYPNDGPASLLDRVSVILRKMHTRPPEISRSGQAVTLAFSDFIFNVVPAFQRDGGGYIIPDSMRNKWIPTDPKLHVEFISRADADHGGGLIPLIKMVKGWNRMNNRPFNQFHLEIMAYHLLKNFEITDYPATLLYFFSEGRQYVRKHNIDPTGYGGDIGGYINSRQKIEEAQGAFETAYKRAHRAGYYGENGRIENSINEWRKLFGDYFPAYG